MAAATPAGGLFGARADHEIVIKGG